ncbi:MAG: AbrB/MazE/SpoVT family DNA-binding domain-containing protein [Proteobacteria bacterium]|nr:AbrB/MazE/SpoVT family DNA-binding domain-containing protein [Pseudomonadota bacterium]
MASVDFYKSRLRTKGQVTLPSEVRKLLSANEGDDLIFRIDENGQVIVERALTIPADQAWFWSERWQRMEREAQADIDSGRVHRYPNVDEAIAGLEKIDNAGDRIN